MKFNLKNALFAGLTFATVANFAAADGLSNLERCASTCDSYCYRLAREANQAVRMFHGACGETDRPKATITVNGQTTVYVRPGDSVFYQWSSAKGVRAYSYYIATGESHCAKSQTAWAANTLNGSTSATVGNDQAGCTYTVHYQVFNQENQMTEAILNQVVTH